MIQIVPPLVVVVEVRVRGLVVERQVGGAREPSQGHVRLAGAFLKENSLLGILGFSCQSFYIHHDTMFLSYSHVFIIHMFEIASPLHGQRNAKNSVLLKDAELNRWGERLRTFWCFLLIFLRFAMTQCFYRVFMCIIYIFEIARALH